MCECVIITTSTDISLHLFTSNRAEILTADILHTDYFMNSICYLIICSSTVVYYDHAGLNCVEIYYIQSPCLDDELNIAV